MSEFIDQFGANDWKADTERQNKGNTHVPEVIKSLPSENPGRKDLSSEQLDDAKKELFTKEFVRMKYPRELKYRVDPVIHGQHFGLVTFYPSKNAIPDSDGCFGVIKFRGAFSTSAAAETHAEMLLREVDTTAEIDMCLVGKEFPIMVDNSIYCRSTREIDIRKKVDDVVRANIRSKNEKEQKDIEDVTKRQQRLLDKTHEDEKETIFQDLDYYTMLRVKKAQAKGLIDEATSRIKEAEDVIASSNEEIDKLDVENPEYKDQFMKKYQDAIESIGGEITENPLIKYLM
jgi:hypothetical protein